MPYLSTTWHYHETVSALEFPHIAFSNRPTHGVHDNQLNQAKPLLIVLLLVYISTILTKRLLFSPIAKFPGPKLAAASFLYEFYYDFICRGRYEFKIEELHEKYGPIIRINPDELHIKDPDFFSQIYVTSGVRKSSRPASHRNATPSRESTATTLDHDHHRQRRKALDPYFSKNMVTKLEPKIQSTVKRLHERLCRLKGSGTPVNLFEVYGAVASDVITEYCFGSSWGSLEKDDYNADIVGVRTFYTKLMPIFRLFPSLLTLSLAIPEWMIRDSGVVKMQDYRHRLEKQVADVKNATGTKKSGGADDQEITTSHTTIFHELLERSTLPPEELTEKRLTDEAITLVGAGLVTTAHTLAFISFYLLNQPGTLAKLQNALQPLMLNYPAETPTWTQLEAVPYLNAVIMEGLRMHGVARRIARIFPAQALEYGIWTIPKGVRFCAVLRMCMAR